MNAKWTRTNDPLGNTVHQFVAEYVDHRKVTGCLWIPKQETRLGVVVAFMHGASGDRLQAPIPYLSNLFANQGVASLAIDGPVHGLRKKLDGGRIALYAEMSKPKAFNHLFKDWELALELVETKLKFSIDTVSYFGLSMGSFFGIPYLANRHLTGKSTAVAVLGLMGPTGVVSPFRKRLLRDASNVHCPLNFLVQQEDEMFSRAGCLELFDALASSSKQIRENPGKHAAVPQSEFDYSFKFISDQLLEDACHQKS
ncbi:MAG: hypothetical protein F4227_04175 [Gammaproteobacteria bacterium]|nr:hypothetical protein [Gammaproteobacteria bacterium]MYF02172.1 hypothetical protein [Gammaproteobacteria bacterium]MYI77530.1 hypothetical protein [Gammaproteobacteria bacterium]